MLHKLYFYLKSKALYCVLDRRFSDLRGRCKRRFHNVRCRSTRQTG